jgi:hypothetical protein
VRYSAVIFAYILCNRDEERWARSSSHFLKNIWWSHAVGPFTIIIIMASIGQNIVCIFLGISLDHYDNDGT